MRIASVAERLSRNSYVIDEGHSHISVPDETSRAPELAVTLARVCPANVYKAEPDGSVSASYEACLECGACLVVAEGLGLRWRYPRGGFGVRYREG